MYAFITFCMNEQNQKCFHLDLAVSTGLIQEVSVVKRKKLPIEIKSGKENYSQLTTLLEIIKNSHAN